MPRGNVIFCIMIHLSMFSSQIILTKKEKMWTDLSVLEEALLKIPLIGASGFHLAHLCVAQESQISIIMLI